MQIYNLKEYILIIKEHYVCFIVFFMLHLLLCYKFIISLNL